MLERCLAFAGGFAQRRATRVVRFSHGFALFDDELPKAWDVNVLWLTSTADASAEYLAEEADRLQGRANLAHRKVIVPGVDGGRLAPAFDAMGWRCKSLMVMPQIRAGEKAGASDVVEMSADELEPFWIERIREAPWADDEIVSQLVTAQHRRRRAADVRYLAVVVDQVIASTCEVLSHSRIAQIESIMTVESYRGKGYASAVISRAGSNARVGGNKLVFLLADSSDWTHQLYGRLGFEPVGSIWEFTRLPI
jgi:GNAT superfamily N-acetyltransferase